jgi:thiamine transport system permease protein
LLGAPFILPTLVAVLGLVAVMGRNGLVSGFLGWFGLPALQIYGFGGVVLAHVFFNLPLATRMILQGWHTIPAERFRLAAALSFSRRDTFRVLEMPMLREIVPGAALVIFLICLTSFAVALTLGGGPRATTVELAIYQAFRFDFDLSRAALLAMVQFGLCLIAGLATFWVARPSALGGGLGRRVERWDGRSVSLTLWDSGLIAFAAVFLLLPITMIVLKGVPALPDLPATVWTAAGRSIVVSLASVTLCIVFALALSLAITRAPRLGSGVLEGAGMLSLAASPLVVGTGLFIIVYAFANPALVALPVTALINAAMALPFALRMILPELRQSEAVFGRLADSLSLTGWARFRLLTLPRLRRPLGFSAGLTAALSMGDLGVIMLFSDQNNATLPLQLYRLMGAYRTDVAAGAALLLLALSLGLFWIFEKGGRGHADA